VDACQHDCPCRSLRKETLLMNYDEEWTAKSKGEKRVGKSPWSECMDHSNFEMTAGKKGLHDQGITF
jgi:hypothetical protein